MSTQLSSSTQKPRTNLDPLFRLITRCFAFLVLALLAAIGGIAFAKRAWHTEEESRD